MRVAALRCTYVETKDAGSVGHTGSLRTREHINFSCMDE
jgi:hypothetical protein